MMPTPESLTRPTRPVAGDPMNGSFERPRLTTIGKPSWRLSRKRSKISRPLSETPSGSASSISPRAGSFTSPARDGTAIPARNSESSRIGARAAADIGVCIADTGRDGQP